MSPVDAVTKFEYIHRYSLALQFVAGKDVLHLVAGEGYGSSVLAQRAAKVLSVDADADAVERAKSLYAQAGNLQFLHGLSGALPLEDQSVDTVVALENFERHEHPDALLVEIKRVLRPNGLLLLSGTHTRVAPGSSATPHDPQSHVLHLEAVRPLLHGHFRNVDVYVQRSNISSFVYPIEASVDAHGLHYDPGFSHEELPEIFDDVPVKVFVLASDDTPPPPEQIASVHSNLTASSDGYALQELMGHIAQLYAEIDTSKRRLASVHGSKFWRLRDAWFGLRDRRAWEAAVVPPLQKFLWSFTYDHPTTRYPIPAMKSVMATVVPPLQKALWGLTYNHLTTSVTTPAMTFMNLGFVGSDDEPQPSLDPADEPNRVRIQLYHHVGTLADLTGQDVLEVGSGRGGGAAYIKRYLGPASMIGMDLAEKAVEFSTQVHRADGLRFMQGDAEKMPFSDQQFDAVINVESSHCYPALESFFREVRRVLRPGGSFLYADVLPSEVLTERRRLLQHAGLELLQERDITQNVLASLNSNTDQRVFWEEALASVFGSAGAREWSMLPGSRTLDGMRDGTLVYVSMALRRAG